MDIATTSSKKAHSATTMAELIRITAIAWASGYTELAIRESLKRDYGLDQHDVDQTIIGCNVLQKGLHKSLKDLVQKSIAMKSAAKSQSESNNSSSNQ